MPETAGDDAHGGMEYVLPILLVLLIVGGATVFFLKRKGSKEPEYMAIVRRYVGEEKYDRAAEIHARAGNHVEAMNLYLRGENYVKASDMAARVGNIRNAATYAERAQHYELAGDHYQTLKDYRSATKMFKRAAKFEKAAHAMEQDSSAPLEQIAHLWETACMDLVPDNPNVVVVHADTRHKIKELAQKAAEAYRSAGNLERASALLQQVGLDNIEERLVATGGVDQLSRLGTVFGSQPDLRVHETTGAIGGRGHQQQGYGHPPGHGPPLHHAGTQFPPQGTQFPRSGNQFPAGGHFSHGPPSGYGATVAPQVIYVRDAVTNEATSVRRETDRYTIGDKLGEGGMAVVYRATDRALERDVAMKFLPEGVTQNPMALRFFEREAKASAALNHPNVITVFDYGVLDGRPFICMELVDGLTVEERMEDVKPGLLSVPEIARIAEGLVAALDAAHRRELVHRDVKPSNVMLTKDGHVKLMDFGIARGVDPKTSTMIVGTPMYMAPEQFEGRGIDPRTDIFSTGVTLYEICTGTLPFGGIDRRRMPERRPGHVRQELPRQLDEVIWRSMQLNPNHRFQSTGELLGELRRIRRSVEHHEESYHVPSTPKHVNIGRSGMPTAAGPPPPTADDFDEDEQTMVVLRDMLDDDEDPSVVQQIMTQQPPPSGPMFTDDLSIGASAPDLSNLFSSLPDPNGSLEANLEESLDDFPGALSQDETLLPNQVSLSDLPLLGNSPSKPASSSARRSAKGSADKDEELLGELESLFKKHALVVPPKKKGGNRTGEFLAVAKNLRDSAGSSSGRRRKSGKKPISADALSDINKMLQQYATAEQSDMVDEPTQTGTVERLDRVEGMLANYLDEK